MSASSIQREAGGLPGVTPDGAHDTVVDQGVADEPFVRDGKIYIKRLKVRTLVHEQRHEASRIGLHDIAARRADEPGFVRIHGLLTQLLEATEGMNDADVLLEIGEWLMRHGAHCIDAVAFVRKPFFRLTLPPLTGKEAA